MTERPRITLTIILFAVSFITYLGCVQEENKVATYTHIIRGSEETCVKCHSNTGGFSPFHSPEIIGCATCHLGDPTNPEKILSHKGMVSIPGQIADMNQTCGASNCHHSIPGRINNSLMTTMAGVITVDRYVFGEEDTLSKFAHIKDLTKTSPADKHLRQLCASCHLGNKKEEFGPITELSRGGGCNACHLQYTPEAIVALQKYKEDPNHSINGFNHPSLTVNVGNDHCFGCHSRSGRISTSYEGWHETTLSLSEIKNTDGYRQLEDGRIFEMVAPDIHHEKGLLCIDCHNSQEIMGDGNIYLHQDKAVKIKCQDCHQRNPQNTITYDQLDPESKKLIGLRGMFNYEDEYLVTASGRIPLYNIRKKSDDTIYLTGKNSGLIHYSPSPPDICSNTKAHSNLSCQSCHTSWTPQCIGCHNTYDAEAPAMDLLDHKEVEGRWIEHIGQFFADPPTLGIYEDEINGARVNRISTFISGMILTIDLSGFPGVKDDSMIHKRLFAPIDAHTTTSESRSCKGCHLDSHALGYGRGKLTLLSEFPYWDFQPDYITDDKDGLPQDAWIPFLKDPARDLSTRPYTRPFNVEEQKKILRVGACLTCHEGDSPIMVKSLYSFNEILEKISGKCIFPFSEEL